MISLVRYAAVLQTRETRLTFALSVIGRLPIGITGLAVLLLVQGETGSFARGGAATAGYVIGLAAVAPVLGRWIDRYGPRKALLASGVLFPARSYRPGRGSIAGCAGLADAAARRRRRRQLPSHYRLHAYLFPAAPR